MPSPQHYTDRRQAYAAWLEANGINPRHVLRDADVTIEDRPTGRVLRCEVCALTPDGKRQLDERLDKVATEFTEVPLLVQPPEWWEPYVKPTRDELLAAVERVHALHRRNENTGECEYCSARDYPDYAVAWPCETIRALSWRAS